jgi:uncharacterized protein
VLAGPLHYTVRQAVPLNLAVSFITIIASLLIRGRVLSLTTVSSLLLAILFLIVGAVVSAFYGPALARNLSDERLERTILVLLLAIGGALIIESFWPQQLPPILPNNLYWHAIAGVLFGLLIGLVSSLLGVAGGELIIPTLVFAFGADIKTAGTGSLLISLPTVAVGLVRYASSGVFAERKMLSGTVVPMGVGSILGAIIGGFLVGFVSSAALKLGLGLILIISALRIFRHQHKTAK